jgi:hypothetical protein
MRKLHIVALFVILSAASPAAAGAHHWATAPTQKQAMHAATDDARARALRKRTCYKPAWTVNICESVVGGVKCRADSADRRGSCRKRGWLDDHDKGEPPTSFMVPVYPLPKPPWLRAVNKPLTLPYLPG